MAREYFPTDFKSYPAASRLTGLSEIQLHRLRIQKVARSKTSGYPDYVPLISVSDVLRWLETHEVVKPNNNE